MAQLTVDTNHVTIPDNPQALGVPHNVWRESQLDALRQVLAVESTGGGFTALELPTGSGKSSVATALGHNNQVTVLVNTIALGRQYEEEYGFTFLPGRQTFDCVLTEKVDEWRARGKGRTPTAADCHFDNPNADCPEAWRCPYLVKKAQALASKRMACTYQYAMLSQQVQKRSGILVADECQHVPEVLLSFTEMKVDEQTRRQYDLPAFPFSAGYGPNGRGDILNAGAKAVVLAWLGESSAIVAGLVSNMSEDEKLSSEATQMLRLLERFRRVSCAIEDGNWFLQTGPEVCEVWSRHGGYRKAPGMFLKALEAKSAAYALWSNKSTKLLMSATIGRPEALASELGIENYAWKAYPHPVPAEARPVFDLHVPRMTAENIRNNPNIFKMQAVIISAFIRSLDPSWRGIVLTSSNTKIRELRNHLGSMFPDRLLVPRDGTEVSARVQMFLADTRPGMFIVDTIQGLGHGLDLKGDLARWVVVAGASWASPVDPYENARKRRPGGATYQQWRTVNEIVQAIGRVSRGERTADGGYLYNCAALADGTTTTSTAMKHYSEWIKEAMRSYP